MTTDDTRRPLDVTAAFHARLTSELAGEGFLPRAKGARLVRKSGRRTHRIELSSSYRNAPGYVVCRVALVCKDADVQKLDPTWSAGGSLAYGDFEEGIPQNIAEGSNDDTIVARIRARLGFFSWLDDASCVARDVGARYVPGFFAPARIVPYLVGRLGVAAAVDYAASLLRGRPELWPAFAAPAPGVAASGVRPDHGTELARSLAEHVPRAALVSLVAPDRTAKSSDAKAANLRCFFGRLLRARGEPAAAAALRLVEEDVVRGLNQRS